MHSEFDHFQELSHPQRPKKHFYLFNPHIYWRELGYTALAVLLGLIPLGIVETFAKYPLLAPSFGASALLLYAAPFSKFAQPRNVIGGHLVASLSGALMALLLPQNSIGMAITSALAICLMLITDTAHPPGGATAIMAFLGGHQVLYIFHTILPGAIWLVLVGIAIGRLSPTRRYPDPRW